MIVKLLKPVPMIDRVINAGEYLDSEKIFVELVHTGRAELVEGKLPDPAGEKPEAEKNPETEKNPEADAENTDKDEANEGCEDGSAPTVNVNVQVSSETKEKRSRSKKAAE